MRKSRGQSLIEFVAIAVLALALVVFAVYKFGDQLADFFAGSDPGKKFNDARTVKFENPEDLISDVNVTFDGINIEPPVEKIIEAGLAGGTYIQTSGSAGRIAEMGKITEEYINQIKKLLIPAGTGGGDGVGAMGADSLTEFENTLNEYKSSMSNGADGFLDIHYSFSNDELLEQKLNLIEMAISLEQSSIVSDIQTKADNYLTTVPGGNRKDIISTFVNDLVGFGNYLDYYIDPSLYMQYLGEEKKLNNISQDKALIEAIQADIANLSQDQKLNKAGLFRVYYGGGYSQVSPSAYNGERMCNTFGGTMISDTECEISAP